MRIGRLRMQRFRGFADADIRFSQHAVLVGQPRAGRSDVVAALRRVLEPASTSARVDPLDVHRPQLAVAEGELTPLTEVEVTLIQLGPRLEQDLLRHLEVLDARTLEPAAPGTTDSVIGLRLCYRLEYDEATGTGTHWVDYPSRSDPATGRWARASRADRELLPFLLIDRQAPLQLRAEGRLRGLMEQADAPATLSAVQDLLTGVQAATDSLSQAAVVREAVARVMSFGAAQLLRLDEASAADNVEFVADDGSTAGLLRATQPALDLDGAGALPLRSHGSTTAGIVAVAEAAAASTDPAAVVVADDFGDDLDSAAGEYLATVLRRGAGQAVLTTRRAEVARAFADEELIRLSLHDDVRSQHQLPEPADRKDRALRRQALADLLTAVTAETVAVLEGPGDLAGYSAIVDRRLAASNVPPPASYSIRLVAPVGSDGGKNKLAPLATLAGDLGFRVRVVLDGDKPNDPDDAALVQQLLGLAETVIRLPDRTAVEGALVDGLPPANVEAALMELDADFGLGLVTAGKTPEELAKLAKSTIKKQNLHREWVERLTASHRPPVACEVLDRLVAAPTTPAALTQITAPLPASSP